RVGLAVTGYDIDQTKVRAIDAKCAPVEEPDLLKTNRNVQTLFKATTDPYEAVGWTEACLFVTPTPSLPDGSFDNQYLREGMIKIADAVSQQRRTTPYIFIVAS